MYNGESLVQALQMLVPFICVLPSKLFAEILGIAPVSVVLLVEMFVSSCYRLFTAFVIEYAEYNTKEEKKKEKRR